MLVVNVSIFARLWCALTVSLIPTRLAASDAHTSVDRH